MQFESAFLVAAFDEVVTLYVDRAVALVLTAALGLMGYLITVSDVTFKGHFNQKKTDFYAVANSAAEDLCPLPSDPSQSFHPIAALLSQSEENTTPTRPALDDRTTHATNSAPVIHKLKQTTTQIPTRPRQPAAPYKNPTNPADQQVQQLHSRIQQTVPQVSQNHQTTDHAKNDTANTRRLTYR